MITIVAYQARWPGEFTALGRQLRQQLGDLALRIDHIGSTAVPELAAKDIIDIQVTAYALTPAIEAALQRTGYQRIERITQDHIPPGATPAADDYYKWFFKPAVTQRAVNLHVRLAGRANQRYALLFRDYLRAHPPLAMAYAQVKMALVKHHPEDDMEVYYDVKDPVCDIINGGRRSVGSDNWLATRRDQLLRPYARRVHGTAVRSGA